MYVHSWQRGGRERVKQTQTQTQTLAKDEGAGASLDHQTP